MKIPYAIFLHEFARTGTRTNTDSNVSEAGSSLRYVSVGDSQCYRQRESVLIKIQKAKIKD